MRDEAGRADGQMDIKFIFALIVTWICVPAFYAIARTVNPEDTWFLYLYKFWVILLGIIFSLYLFANA